MASITKASTGNPYNEGAAVILSGYNVIKSVRGKEPVDEWSIDNERLEDKFDNNLGYQSGESP